MLFAIVVLGWMFGCLLIAAGMHYIWDRLIRRIWCKYKGITWKAREM